MPRSNPKPMPKRHQPNWWQRLSEGRKIKQKLNSKHLQANKSKQDLNNFSKPNIGSRPRLSKPNNRQKVAANMRVLKPAKGIDLQSYLHSSMAKPSKTMQVFGKLPGIQSIFTGFTLSDRFKNFNYTLLRLKVFSFFNWIILCIVILGLSGAFVYISFFDRYFLVTNYEIVFSPGSYLDEPELESIITRFSTNKTGGLLPENQYWFLNDRNLTLSADKIVPEINKVSVKERIWPNQAVLEIQTEPILATLSIEENNQRRSWRVSQSGKVFTEDKAGLNKQLIYVQRPITYDRLNVTFKDYNLEANTEQLNRIWFTNVLWVFFDDLEDVGIISSQFPSMTDTDVELQTDTGSILYFSSDFNTIPRENLESRLRGVFNSTIANDLKAGRVAYIDFRIPNKAVFICYKNQPCQS
jgi:hypothetical protein